MRKTLIYGSVLFLCMAPMALNGIDQTGERTTLTEEWRKPRFCKMEFSRDANANRTWIYLMTENGPKFLLQPKPYGYGTYEKSNLYEKHSAAFLRQYLFDSAGEAYVDLPVVNAPWRVVAAGPAEGLLRGLSPKSAFWGLALLFGFGGIYRSIWSFSQRREAVQEKQRMEAEKMQLIARMSAGIAHEIKNPLTSLKGFLQYVYHKQKNEHPEQEKFFHIMFDEIDRIETLANQFCMVAKPAEKVKKQGVPLNEILEQIYLLLSLQAKKRGTEFVYLPFATNVSILGNPQQLKQIFINLLNNAFEAVRENGKVQIACDEREQNCQIRIMDNGIGIKEEDLKKLGTVFYTTKERGNGLGLAITQELVKEHNGNMTIESKYGEGTTFILTFPIYTSKDSGENKT